MMTKLREVSSHHTCIYSAVPISKIDEL